MSTTVDSAHIASAFVAYVTATILGRRTDPRAVELAESANRILDVSPFDFRKPEVRKTYMGELEGLMEEAGVHGFAGS